MTAAAVGALFPGPYRVPKASFSCKTVYTNTAGRTAYRGPWQFETLAREMLLDIAARDSGFDPAELRRRNLLRADDLPYTSPNGMTYDSISPLETFEHALELLDYDAFRVEQAAARAEGRYLGVGISNYVEPSTPGFGYYGTEGATIRIEPSGTVNVYIAGGSTGNSIETTVVQLAADALGVDIDDVATIQGDTALTGFGAGAAGSRSGSMTAGAIGETAAILRERLVAIAAHKLEAAPEDIELAASRASVRGTPDVNVSFATLARMAYFEPQSLPEGVPAGLEASARYAARTGSIFVNATHVCTCEVDVSTGKVTLLRYIVSEDCGPMINPNVVEGQIAGGTVQGIGGALLRAPRVRRRRQPGHHHAHGLPGAHVGRGADPRVRARGDPEPGTRWVQGRGGGRRHRCATGGGQRGGRRTRAVRGARHRVAADPVGDRRAARLNRIQPNDEGGTTTWESSTARSR